MQDQNKTTQKINIDIADADTMKCSECNCEKFDMKYLIKKVSALLSPTGQEMVIPIQVFACANCGIIPDEFLPAEGNG